MNKKVLIVGGAGYIGGNLVNLCQYNKCYTPTVLDNLTYEDRYLKDVNFINADIRDLKNFKNTINQYDVVVFLAALVGDPACAVDKQLSYDINVTPAKWLAENYKGKIIFTSTCSIYGKNNDLIDETADSNPLSTYAETKLEAEQYLFKLRPESLIFRLGTLYGIGDTHSRLRLDLVVNILTLKASQGIQLEVFGGEQWRPLLHVRDVGNAIMYGIDKDLKGIYNLSEQNVTMKDIANSIIRTIPTATVEYSDLPFQDMRNYRVKNNKILSTGWSPTLTLSDGITELNNLFIQKRVKEPNNNIYHNGNFIKFLYKKV